MTQMTKKQFIQLAKERGVGDVRYQGKTKTFFLRGSIQIASAFLSFLSNTNNWFKVAISSK